MLVKVYPQEKALLFGLNKYPGAPLAGCVNDVEDMANLQVDRYGWDPGHVRLLTDARCKRKEMLHRMEWLVDVKKGDRVLFHQSGHGVQWPSRSHSGEPDGLLEAFCPIDFWWGLEGMITDKQYVEIFSRIPKGVEFTWVNDSCHSGDLTRAMPGNPHGPKIVPRAYPVPEDIAWRHRGLKTRGINGADRAMVCGTLDVGFVSGCKSNQTSADTYVNNRPCGALTHYLIETLKTTDIDEPLVNVVATTRAKLKRMGYTQEPQSEGRRVNKPFMSVNKTYEDTAPIPHTGLVGETGATGPAGSLPETHYGPTGPTGVTGPTVSEDGTFALPFDKEGPQNVCPNCGKKK